MKHNYMGCYPLYAIVNGTLFILLAAAKLLEIINISWWWVTSPIWIPSVALFILFSIVIITDKYKQHNSKKYIRGNLPDV